jgi:hypothetical protein
MYVKLKKYALFNFVLLVSYCVSQCSFYSWIRAPVRGLVLRLLLQQYTAYALPDLVPIVPEELIFFKNFRAEELIFFIIFRTEELIFFIIFRKILLEVKKVARYLRIKRPTTGDQVLLNAVVDQDPLLFGLISSRTGFDLFDRVAILSRIWNELNCWILISNLKISFLIHNTVFEQQAHINSFFLVFLQQLFCVSVIFKPRVFCLSSYLLFSFFIVHVECAVGTYRIMLLAT